MTRSALPSVLWSKGIALWADHAGDDDYWRRPTESLEPAAYFRKWFSGVRGVVWVRLGSRGGLQSDVASFAEVLDALSEPIVLVTTDGDTPAPSGLDDGVVARIVEHPCVLKWYTQNYDGAPLDKLEPLPIGLDLHTRHDDEPGCPEDIVRRIRSIRANAEPPARRSPLLFCDLHLSMCHPERLRLLKALEGAPGTAFLSRRLPRALAWRHYADFALALSTHGNGLDCHRTWELLMLGCIVVTRSSPLDPLFRGLPVAIVEDWEECLEPDRRRCWVEQLEPLTAAARIEDRLSASAWVREMRSHLSGHAADPT